MIQEMGQKWKTQTRGEFTFESMCEAIKQYIQEDPESNYKISVGTDSQRHKGFIKFVSAIVVHKVGHGAQYYWTVEDNTYMSNSLRQKIMYEVSLTYNYKTLLKEALADILKEYNIAIKPHADIGEHGETKKLIDEIRKMFKGFGKEEEVEIKPYSNTASAVANKHSK